MSARKVVSQVEHTGRDKPLPLSFAQQQLWFLEQLEPGNPAYNILMVVHLAGQLSVDALHQSLDEIVRRHEALRTRFVTVEGQPVQVIASALVLYLPLIDLRQLSETERQAQVGQLAQEQAQYPFDLAQGPLVRTTLLRLSEAEHVLLLTVHHLVSDDWSLGVIARELATLYKACSEGEPPVLSELPIQYADYAVWQREWLRGQILDQQLAYWERQLGDSPSMLELPTDHPRPAVQTYRGAHQPFALSQSLIEGLKAQSRREESTLFTMLLAAFQVLLHRYTGQVDISIGSPVVNRNRSELENLIGFFVNTLVVRTDLSGDPSFRELLKRVREVTLEAQAHQDLPFERLVEELQPERNLAHNPLFQVMFALQDAPMETVELPGLTLSLLEAESGTAKFDLTLFLWETEQRLKGTLEYNTDLFEAATVNRMLGHFQNLLEGIVTDPGQRISGLPLLTEAERHQALVTWNEIHAAFPQNQCIHELFEEQVARTPDAVALVFEGQALTYVELDARANQLARYLCKLGVGPEALVGLSVERSLELVVGILGIFKAGGGYVPLDPLYPKERLALMLEDARPLVLLTQVWALTRLPDYEGPVVCLDADWATITQESTRPFESEVIPENLAYVIYTSGSTGRPKGVLIAHANVCPLLYWGHEFLGLRPADRCVQYLSFSFDWSVWEMFIVLTSGGSLFMLTREEVLSPEKTLEFVAENEITVLHGTPTQFQMLTGVGQKLKTLRHACIGAEKLTSELVERCLQELDAKCRLYNMYGPTEAAILATTLDIDRGALDAYRGLSSVPIGPPLANARCYILDRYNNVQPVSVPGELYIAGDCLARGYLGRPELTAERFVPNPLLSPHVSEEQVGGERLYKTVDLARWLPDGNIEFLGRIDQQVKLRGYRIELGEIEVLLGRHPTVHEAVVMMREDAPGDKRLAAYVVARNGQEIAVGDLRRFLQENLPDYMVPSVFVVVESLPLTSSGKLDRRSLPAPEQTRPGPEKTFVAPRTPIEEMVAGIWTQVLGLERIGIHDSFFELGGHSLLATQVLSRVRDAFQVELPVRRLFEAPTVAGLAESIELIRRAERDLAPSLVRVARDRELPLSFAQQRLWFLDRLEPGNWAYNLPEAIRLVGQLDIAALKRSLNEIVCRHEVLRTAFATVDGQPVQIIAPALDLALSIVDLQSLPEAEREVHIQRLVSDEAQQPFDLACGPLLRTALLHLSDAENMLLLTMHHIVSDGWSRGVFNRELAALYEAFSAGRSSPLVELSVQYSDFAVWQREWLQGQVLETQLAYWKQQLDGSPPVLELPIDHPRPAVQTYRGMHQAFALSPSLTESLKTPSRREGGTLFMTLLAAFQTLLHRYTGQADISVGSPIANRNRTEVEGLIGFFVNTLVLRTDLSGDPSFRELLKRVREVTLGAYAHQDLPLEKLVETLQPERSSGHTPLFQVLFVLENAPMQSLELPGLTIGFLEVETGAVKFDLTLTIEESSKGLTGLVGYNTDLFEHATIQRMIGHFQILLEGIVADPECLLSELPLLSENEQRQLLEWSVAGADYQVEATIPELFAAQVERTPDRIMVVLGDAHLTCQSLNRRTNQLAHYLQRLGVGPEVLVGLCVERSIELLVGLLGILKAGGAYVPLDPLYPKERLAFMLADARLAVLLTQAEAAARLPEPREGPARDQTHWVCLDHDWEAIAVEGQGDLVSEAKPDHLAYVIYTSGSTGQPKGVLIAHANVIPILRWSREYFGLGEHSRVLQNLNPCFDFGVFELLTTVLFGGTLYLLGEGAREELGGYEEYIREQGINTIHATPSFFHQVVLASEGLETLEIVHLGGEALTRNIVDDIFGVVDEACVVYNGYGPTEASINCCIFRVGSRAMGESARLSSLPIGRASANNVVYILDRRGQLVPIGVPGELYVGGPALARGYLNRPELAARQFIPNPFSEQPGERLYRTGDRVRYLPDGNIEFLGRIDLQVKIRGFRIELGEIEARLEEHPALREALVLARDAEHVPGDKYLVAYVVPHPGQAPTTSELRAFLKDRLPEYILPSAFVELERLPLTPSGKVNYRALPAPGRDRPKLGEAYAEPSTPLEHILAKMWQDLTGVERIGIHDNFFELGGDSLRAAVFINRLQKELGKVVYVVVLFDAPTIADLAAYLTQHYAASVERMCRTRFPGETYIERQVEVREAVGVDESKIEAMRRLIESRYTSDVQAPASKNPRMIFILTAARSGSTLLRVMLAGHPRLFSPPELALLSFRTLAERKAAFSGRDSGWLEGLLRAVMQIKSCDLEQARQIVAQAEDQNVSTHRFYGAVQKWIGDRILVDKTVTYALDLRTLERAEAYFDEPLYIHLVRHPAAMIQSYLDSKLDQVLGYSYPYPVREKAELFWLISNQNVLDFFKHIPERRRYFLRFEDLVQDPRGVMESLCQFLGLDFDAEMLEPYRGDKMTDGVHPESRMVGDPRFHTHQEIESEIRLKWQALPPGDTLSRPVQELAEGMGYQIAPSLEPLTGLQPASRDRELALSFAQQRLWFLDQLVPGSPFYNMASAYCLKGSLHVVALEQSLDKIVQRHEALRTSFAAVDGRPVQVIAPSLTLPLPVVDLQALTRDEREAEVCWLSLQEAQRPFDLTRGPLVRTILLRLGAEEHVLLLTMHHIISDEWSFGVLNRELGALYTAFVEGGEKSPAPLSELPVQYADYAMWQREWLRGEVMETQLTYWKRQLGGESPVLELPTDRPRPPVQTYRGAHQSFALPLALSEELKALSRREGATLFMTLLAAFEALLYRYTGQTDIVVGAPIANRNRAEIEGLIGFFINTLALRIDLSGNPTFLELLGRVREMTLGAYAHQDLPFERLVEELSPERNLSYNPLFQAAFILQKALSEPLELPGLTQSPIQVEDGVSKFDLTLAVEDTRPGLIGVVEYSTDLFDAATIGRLTRHFQALLEGIVADPDQRLADLPLLAESERRQLFVEWNGTRTDYPWGTCIHELFEAQVERAPEAVAVVCEDEHVTYRELNGRANQLAHHLAGSGIGPETLVAICLGRSVELVVGLLGVLKAGGAYVPLDPAYPVERLDFMLTDSRAVVLLTQERLVERLVEHTAGIVCVDADWDEIGRRSRENPARRTTSDDLAYVIYTSGSTGKPKGVAVEHHSTAALLAWGRSVFASELLAGVLASTSICFDLSVFEIFMPLSVGGSVILAETVLHLPGMWSAGAVTLINTVPSAMKELLRIEGVPAGVQIVNLAGEPLQAQLVEQIYQQTQAQVFDLYGPSEDTTYSTWAEREAGEPATIGRPIANTQIYLLDNKLNPVPVGVPGELYIGGAGLARGYLSRPELTAERFIPHAFNGRPGARLYKTVDLARYRPSGNLEFLGRLDHQVKVRGFRIELGEIEAALGQHSGVREAVALAREDIPGDKRLVAYVVPREGQALGMGDLRRFLQEKLPDYMLPSTFMILEVMPLTPNGKIDRQALIRPDSARPELDETALAPRTPVEEVLAGIWADVLGLDQVGINDNFFDLGGHSLLATQVVSRIGSVFQIELSLRGLFEASTVAELAECIEEATKDEHEPKLTPIVRVSRDGMLPLSFGQQRLWFFDQLEPASSAYISPAVYRLKGALDVAAIGWSLNQIVRRHEALRTSFAAVDGRPIQVIAPSLALPLPVVDLQALAGGEREAEVRRLNTQEAQRPFDLTRSPLVRTILLRLGAEEHVLLLTMHHIVFDGWSFGVFNQELTTFYTAFVEGGEGSRVSSPLPELAIQYADYAVWQREWLHGEVLERQLVYWKRQLGGELPALEFPTDRPRPAVQTYHGAHRSFALPRTLSEGLKALSRREGVTLFMTLLAGFKALLYRYTRQTDISVGTPIANRNRAEIEGLVGFFVNTLVLRTDLAGDPTFCGLLKRVREMTLGAYAHQDLPFEKLVEMLRLGRDTSYNPLFQVMFVFQNVAMALPKLPELSIELVSVETHAAQFDLNLTIKDDSERGLTGFVEYNTDLFDGATADRMLEHYQTVLEIIVADPSRPLSTLLTSVRVERHLDRPRPELKQDVASLSRPEDEIAHRRAVLSARRTKLSAAKQARLEERMRSE